MVNDHFQIVFFESKQGQAFWFVEIVYVLTMPIVDDHGKEFYAYMLVYVDDINYVIMLQYLTQSWLLQRFPPSGIFKPLTYNAHT